MVLLLHHGAIRAGGTVDTNKVTSPTGYNNKEHHGIRLY